MIRGARARGQSVCSSTAPMQILREQRPIGIPGMILRRNEACPKAPKMKRILIYISLTMAVLCSMGCKKEAEQRTYFSAPQEAANKAKNDLLTVLRSGNEIALGLEQQTIEKSQPAAPVKQYQITFEDLASADSFIALRRNEMATVVPLVADGTVATVVAVAKDEAGWKIVSLADKSL